MRATKYLTGLICIAVSALLTACHTTDPSTGQRVPDKAKTEQVKALVQGVTEFAFTEALAQFPQDADQIALYARAAGGVFCEMYHSKQFSPEALEAALSALLLPKIENPDTLRYVQTARNAILTTYRMAYAKRFNAELNPDEWPAVVSEIFCASLNQGLINSGRPGVPNRYDSTLPPTAPQAALRELLDKAP